MNNKLFFAVLLIVGIFSYLGCKHEPKIKIITDTTPTDTTGNTPKDTISNGNPCSPDTVYFERDILPLLGSNCALSGCHDAITAEDGINYSTYSSTMSTGKVKPGKVSDSKIYTMLSDSKERMPPPPMAELSAAQKALIAKWITQGAKNLKCNDCDSTNVGWAKSIEPLINNYCKGCHSGGAPSGNILLTNYAEVKTQALNGKLYGTTAHIVGYKAMPPYGSNQLDACKVKAIEKWVAQGAPQN